MFNAWGHFVYRFRWLVLVVSLALVAGSVVAILTLATSLKTSDSGAASMEATRAYNLIAAELPAQQGSTFQLIFTAKDRNLKATDPAFTAAMNQALAPLRDDPRVDKVTTSAAFISKDGHRAFAIVSMPAGFSEALKQYPDVRGKVTSDTFTITATGYLPINEAFNATLEHDLVRAEVIGLPLALLVLAFVFGMVLWRLLRQTSLRTTGLALALTGGSLALALIPLLVGLFTIGGGVAGIYALAHRRDMSVYALNIASMIGLGVAIDYSLFIVSRFLEEVARRPVGEAVARTVATTGRAIAFSGLKVAIGVSGMLFYHSEMLTSMGLAAIAVVVTAVIYGLTFVPALLSIVGNGLAARARRRAASGAARPATVVRHARAGIWHRLALGVMAHPWRVLLPLLAILLAVGSPFLNLRLGLTEPSALPESSEARQGWDLLTTQFPGGENTAVTVVVNYPAGNPLGGDHVARLYDYSQWLATLPNVSRVDSIATPPGPDGKPLPKEQATALYRQPAAQLPAELQTQVHQSVGAHIVSLSVLTPLTADSAGAHELVKAIRAGGGPNPGGQVLVTGDTALTIDQVTSMTRDTLPAGLFIIVATYIVLFLLLGSVVLPLKAVLMNFLSITASYGALVWIFQEGHLSNLLQFTPHSIDPLIPVLMFCILFGLSMDYEVLLLSRMKEEYDRTGANRIAVAEGLEQTGRLITSAAAIMIFVFGGFALAQVTLIKAIGLGMAIAVAVDALVVRTLVIPATMRLLGDWNWWAPAPLARLYHRLGLAEQHTDEPVASPQPEQAPEPEREMAGVGAGDR
jgi:putative drug exporter of the RND superfamily